MRAFVFAGKGIIEERELPNAALDPHNEDDRRACILKPLFVSPCSSDVHTVYAGAGPRRENLVLGHEGIAEVVDAGPSVRDFKRGDRVVVSAVSPEPGDVSGHLNMPFSASKLGRNINGMWSELFKLPDADINMAHLPCGMSIESALMAADMMATGATAVAESGMKPGADVLIIGSGAVGLMAAFMARHEGTGRIYMIGTDRNMASIDAARGFGVDIYISYRDGHIVFDSAMPDKDRYIADDSTVTERNEVIDTEDSVLGNSAMSDKYGYIVDDSTVPERNKAIDTEDNVPGNSAMADMADVPMPETRPYDSRANSLSSLAVDTVLTLTGGRGIENVLICGGGADELAEACDMASYGTGVIVNVSYIEGSGFVSLPIFSLGRGMSGKTFKFCLSRGGRLWTEKMLGIAMEAEQRSGLKGAPGRLVTHRLTGFDRIPEGLGLMRGRENGLIKVMIDTGL